MAGVGQNQVQGPIPPQMNRQMQASPLPGQQQMSMGMNDPNHRAALQQQQQQQQAMLQQQQQQDGSFSDDDYDDIFMDLAEQVPQSQGMDMSSG